MASPDATAYIDLRLNDRDPQQVFEAGLVNLQTYAPEWTPREGHTEVLLLEAVAFEVSESIFAINRLPGSVLEALLRLHGVERDLGAQPTTSLRFTVADTNGHVLPPGVRAAVQLGDTGPVVFTTTAQLTIPPGSRVGTVAAVGDRFTDDANGLDAGTPATILDAIVYVESVQLDSSVVGGAAEEDDQAWFSRGVTRLGRLSETLVLRKHFQAATLEFPAVTRALAVDNYDATRAGAPGTHPGFVTVAVYGDGGPLPADQRTTIQVALQAQAQANLAVRVASPTVTAVSVTTTVLAQPGYPVATVQTSVRAALDAYLAPETWQWGGTVYRNELLSVIDQAEGVQRVVTLTVPAGDVVLTGVAPLADLGAATVSVTLP